MKLLAMLAVGLVVVVGGLSTLDQRLVTIVPSAPIVTRVQVALPTPAKPATQPRLPEPANNVVETAMRWMGVPYRFGGCDMRGVDCSCFVQMVYRALGVSLPRVAADQYNATARLSQSDLRPGDLVFFANTYMPGISHVGLYLGNGLQINAPTEGQGVSIQPVFTGYWGAHYAGGGRVRG